jgi:hypothetical protein
MVRFPNRRDHSMTPGPPVPEKGAAGKDEKRNEKIRAKQGQTYTNRHQRKIDNPFTETVDGVLGISKDRVEEYKPVYEFDAAGLTSSGDVRNPSKRVSEHLLTGGARWDTRKQPGAPEGGTDGDENRSQVAGLLSFEAPDAPATFANLAGPDAAGKRTVELSSHNGVPIAMMADAHVAQKVGGRVPRKGPTGARRNVSTVDEIVFGRDTDDSGSADTRDFHGAGGSRTEPPEGPSCFWHRPPTAKYTGLESTADAVIFGRDLDQSSKNPDPRDFSGAAGNPSSSADHAGIFNEAESERVRFEDIPHSMFSAPGRKMVRSQGTTADNVIQYKPDDPSETNFVSEMKEYHGAAGESSKKASDRAVSEMMSNKKKTKGGDSEIDALVFNRDLDNSDAYEAAEDELYKGAFGTRSKCNFNPHDMSQRVMWKDGKVITGERMNDGMLYGNNVVQGTDIDGDTKNDTRDFEGAAGNSTQYLAERELCLVDITKRQASVGSSLVNPSSADELIFGRNVDASGDDPRDFVDSAGEGAYMNRRNPYDVTNTYKRRSLDGVHRREPPAFGDGGGDGGGEADATGVELPREADARRAQAPRGGRPRLQPHRRRALDEGRRPRRREPRVRRRRRRHVAHAQHAARLRPQTIGGSGHGGRPQPRARRRADEGREERRVCEALRLERRRRRLPRLGALGAAAGRHRRGVRGEGRRRPHVEQARDDPQRRRPAGGDA